MRRMCVVAFVLMGVSAHAQEQAIVGRVTYLASGGVYTSLGRDNGVQDSTLLFVTSKNDTTALLKVFAVSSKSSVCRVIRTARPIVVGDNVVGTIQVQEENKAQPDSVSSSVTNAAAPSARSKASQQVEKPAFVVDGRVSAQYSTSFYSNGTYNITQPGVVVNLQGRLRDVPLKLNIYANLRSLSVGSAGLFSRSAVNQSRIYGLAVGYDDGQTVATLGRLIPIFSPSIGYIDGLLLSRRIGQVVVGVAAGFQPDYSLRSVSADYKKIALFTQILSPDLVSFSLSTAYARTYFHSALDREAVSMLANASLGGDVFLYVNAEADVRKKSGDEFAFSPRLTTGYVNLNFRVSRLLSVGIGADASRPYYSFEAIRRVPDSLLADELRTGMSLNMSWFLPGGISLFNTFTPRKSPSDSFGKEYSNVSSLGFSDLFSSGVNIRSTFNLHANRFTDASGFGVSLQRAFAQTLDFTVRFHRSSYTVRQNGSRSNSTTIGANIMMFLTHSLTLITTYDRFDGYGTISNSIFAELSVRF